MSIAITGATGALGGRVAVDLADRGVAQRLVVRDAARAPRLPGASVAVASYDDRAAAALALRGIETLFMVSAKESPERITQHRTFIDAAREAGVRNIIYTSFAGAAPDATFTFARDHQATEAYLAESGMHVTTLRDNFYMDVMAFFPDAHGVIRGPAGDGVAALVARADVALAASAIVTDPTPHRNRRYEMTGPEALSLVQVAAALTAATGRDITFQDETLTEAYESRAHYGAAEWEVDAWVSTYTAIAAGELALVSDDVELLTGRRPQTFEEFLATST